MNGLRQINSLVKTKYIHFHELSREDTLSLLLFWLLIKKHKVQRVKSRKIFCVLLDEILPWKDDIKYIENEVTKNIGLLYRDQLFLDKNSLLALYYSYIHIIIFILFKLCEFISTKWTNLEKLLSQQKHTVRIINNRTRFHRTRRAFQVTKNIRHL